jgi:hypothetical protein
MKRFMGCEDLALWIKSVYSYRRCAYSLTPICSDLMHYSYVLQKQYNIEVVLHARTKHWTLRNHHASKILAVDG